MTESHDLDPASLEDDLVGFASQVARVGGWRVDLPDKLTWSYAVRDILGVPAGTQLELEQALSFHPPEWRARAEEALRTCALQGVPYDVELQLLNARGERLWVRSIGQAVRGPSGDIVAVQGALQDITEKKQAQHAVEQSEKRFRLLGDSMPWIVWTARPDGTVDYFNKAAFDYSGSLDPDNLSEAWLGFIHPDDAALAWSTWERGVREEQEYQVELRIRRADGAYRWHLNRGIPVRDESGRLVQWYGAATDIHDRRVSEQANQRLAAQLSATLESITDAFYILDHDWCFRYLNKQAERLLFRGRDELLGRNVWEEFPEARATSIGSEYERAVSQRCTVTFEAYYPALGWFNIRAYPSDEGLAVYFTNITADKEAEAERATLEAQLLQAQKMEAVGRLAGGVAHDFNNMLMLIQGHVEIMLEGDHPGSQTYPELMAIAAAARRSADLTRQLLAFARKQTIAPRILDLNQTLAGMLGMLRRLLGEEIRLVYTPGDKVLSVRIDPAQLDQVIVNLAINARDAISSTGSIEVQTANVDMSAAQCATRPGLLPGAYVRLSVSDDGCGMDEEVLSRMFEPFFTTKGQGVGTGLGLATCYGIIKQNEGYIEVSSTLGQGTRFEVYLPGQPPAQDPAQPAALDAVRGGETVLLVEDEPALLNLCERRLKQLGYNVLPMGCPQEAIRFAETYPQEIHLLLTDVIMPNVSGEQVWTRVRAGRPDLRCLFMSGYTADIIGRRGVLDQDIAFLEKPFTQQSLAAKVRQALEQPPSMKR